MKKYIFFIIITITVFFIKPKIIQLISIMQLKKSLNKIVDIPLQSLLPHYKTRDVSSKFRFFFSSILLPIPIKPLLFFHLYPIPPASVARAIPTSTKIPHPDLSATSALPRCHKGSSRCSCFHGNHADPIDSTAGEVRRPADDSWPEALRLWRGIKSCIYFHAIFIYIFLLLYFFYAINVTAGGGVSHSDDL